MKYWRCRKCDDMYEETDKMENSRKLEDFLKSHLGFCSKKCWDTLTKKTQEQEHYHYFIYKDKGKSRKEVGFKKFGLPK